MWLINYFIFKSKVIGNKIRLYKRERMSRYYQTINEISHNEWNRTVGVFSSHYQNTLLSDVVETQLLVVLRHLLVDLLWLVLVSQMLLPGRDLYCFSKEILQVHQSPSHRQFSFIPCIKLLKMYFHFHHPCALFHFGLLYFILDNFLDLFFFYNKITNYVKLHKDCHSVW